MVSKAPDVKLRGGGRCRGNAALIFSQPDCIHVALGSVGNDLVSVQAVSSE